MIRLEHLGFMGYHHRVFSDLNLSLDAPGIYGLLGENGVGKTTLLQLIDTLYFPDRGRILIDGQDSRTRDLEVLKKLYFLPDASGSTVPLKFKDYVRAYAPFYEHFDEKVLHECMGAFHVDPQQAVIMMSLGERKKAMVSMAIAAGTQILLMDEPMNGLDIPSMKLMRQLLLRFIREDQLVLISTHHVLDLEKVLDHLVILGGGDRVFSGSMAELSARYAFVDQADREGALYAEPSLKGFRVLKDNAGEDTDVDIELLFNAVTKGGLR